MSARRDAAAFLAAGLTTLVGVAFSSVVQAGLHRDEGYLAGAVLVLFFGAPIAAVPVLAAALLYVFLRRTGHLSRTTAVAVGGILGGTAAALVRAALLPVWSGVLVGALAGALWWRVHAGGASRQRAT